MSEITDRLDKPLDDGRREVMLSRDYHREMARPTASDRQHEEAVRQYQKRRDEESAQAALELSSDAWRERTGSGCSRRVRDVAVDLATAHQIPFAQALKHILG